MVCGSEHRLGRGCRVVFGQTDGDSSEELEFADLEGRRHDGTEPVGDDEYLLTSRARADDDELVATEPAQELIVPQGTTGSKTHVRLHLAPQLSGIKLGELRPSHVSAIAEALNSTGRIHRAGAALGAGGRLATRYPSTGRHARTLSPKTIRNILSTLSSVMKTAVNDDLLRSNPVRDAEIVARPRDEGVEELVVFDTVQADALADWCLSNIESEPWALPVLIGLDCGLRRGEIMAVKSTMIHEQTNRLKVNTGITEEDDLLVDKRLKTKRARRTVVIPDRTIAAVKRYRQHDGVTPINGLLFVGRDGGLANPDTFTQAVTRYLRPQLADMLGEIPWTPHTLRHTFATRLLSENVAPQTVSGLLGHESTAFTLARYSHWVDSDPPLLTSQVTAALGA